MSRRLHDLVSFNEILWPTSIYRLDFGVAVIEGDMTVVKAKSRLSLPPRLIRLRSNKIKTPMIPDIVSLARWLFGLRESGFLSCVVHNYGLTGETSSSEEFTEQRAQTWLAAAIQNWVTSKVYPSPGDHCKDCRRPCLSL